MDLYDAFQAELNSLQDDVEMTHSVPLESTEQEPLMDPSVLDQVLSLDFVSPDSTVSFSEPIEDSSLNLFSIRSLLKSKIPALKPLDRELILFWRKPISEDAKEQLRNLQCYFILEKEQSMKIKSDNKINKSDEKKMRRKRTRKQRTLAKLRQKEIVVTKKEEKNEELESEKVESLQNTPTVSLILPAPSLSSQRIIDPLLELEAL